MANQRHLKILSEGVKFWNNWRSENPDVNPDLSGADLIENDFSGINFRKINLIEAKLRGVNLEKADLRFANLIGTKLFKANLIGASLNRSELKAADFKDADLSNSDMSQIVSMGCNFWKANLQNTDLSFANISYAKFTDTNFKKSIFYNVVISNCTTLSKARNLDAILHRTNSSIDHITLRACVSELPFSFLQGIGYTNEEIEYLKAQYSKSIQYYSCFISYSSIDEEFAKDLHSRLRDSNITVWFAPEDLKIGDKIRARINEQIRIYDKLLIILSKNSVKSSWVKYEVETALDREIKENKTILFPIRLDDSIFDINESWAVDIQSRHIGDFKNWENRKEYQKSLERLIKDLKADQN